jgi:hypothetical protein
MAYAKDYISNLALPYILQDYLEDSFKIYKQVETISPINIKVIQKAVDWYIANPDTIYQVSNTLFLDPHPDWAHFLKQD